MSEIHLLGIRHHGPGSCRNVLEALEEIAPDLILLEGPAEAEMLLPFVANPQMQPPIAMLGYQSDMPKNAVLYPFAEFSPEWQTLKYAIRENVVLRFFDLPLAYTLAFSTHDKEGNENENETVEEDTDKDEEITDEECESDKKEESDDSSDFYDLPNDVFDLLAEASGYPDGETWWNMTIEQRRDNTDIFEAIKDVMTAIREEFGQKNSKRDTIREAWMRRMLREAQKEPFERIAVICGAWHVPALENMPKVKDDNEILKGLAKVKVECTWIPWTNDRLTYRSGYGAGIESPGWYEYLWRNPNDDGSVWVSHIAELYRNKNMDISVAHVIETVRLAHSIAALRGMPTPTLHEYNEAITTVMGFGDDTLLNLIKESLIVGNRLGQVPDNVPKVPLMTDVERLQKRLRVPFTAEIKELILDLRKEKDLERSIFFHRLSLLDINWARQGFVDGKGTFKERWTLEHKPEHIITIIERAIWGNTLEEAVRKYISSMTAEITDIPDLTHLLKRVIPANLPKTVGALTSQLDNLSAASNDIVEMMSAIPDLVQIVRYGDVRNLDFSRVREMLRAMVARILAGGLLACININEDVAVEMLEKLESTNYAVSTLNDDELNDMWNRFIIQLRNAANVHPLISGYATRLLNDKREISFEDMRTTLKFYSSVGNSPSDMAYWFEGFLKASGTVLILDDNLWGLINSWICEQTDEAFIEMLPILKRTFSEFSSSERRKLGEKAKNFETDGIDTHNESDISFNETEAMKVLPLIGRLLGLE